MTYSELSLILKQVLASSIFTANCFINHVLTSSYITKYISRNHHLKITLMDLSEWSDNSYTRCSGRPCQHCMTEEFLYGRVWYWVQPTTAPLCRIPASEKVLCHPYCCFWSMTEASHTCDSAFLGDAVDTWHLQSQLRGMAKKNSKSASHGMPRELRLP